MSDIAGGGFKFKLTIVADEFQDITLAYRWRLILDLIPEEMKKCH